MPTSTQQTLFSQVNTVITEFTQNGVSGTIFAYGQTGAGKTYSIIGDPNSTSTAVPGVLPRTLEMVFDSLEVGSMV